jgi:beta-hydroxyacyl-ACP dehydratase FabZ
MILDTNAIQRILPHRYPFLMVDAILEMEPKKRIVGVKNVTINEDYFVGHFPSQPIMPGVLIIESMAQAAAVLLLQEVEGAEGKLPFLAAIESVRFRRPVVPGDQLIVEVTVLKSRSNFCQVKGIAKVNGETAAEAVLSCLMVDREPVAAAPVPVTAQK